MGMVALTDEEFEKFRRFIFEAAGIALTPAKKALVRGRLVKRLAHCRARSYGQYFELLASGQAEAEVQAAVDLLTTNQTSFFREPKHFELLAQLARQAAGRATPFRVWSAASSSGEEAYSIAMVLADCLGSTAWEIVGSDISTRVLARARSGHYPGQCAQQIPLPYLQRYCLKGIDEQEGTLLIDASLRRRVRFLQVNLNQALPQLGQFDLIFLRNVMIYFNGDTKRQVVARVLAQLKPGGHFFIGHSESLNDISDAVRPLAPSIYRRD